MPKLVNKLPKYSLHKATGQARVKYNGKTTYLGKYGSDESKEAYSRFIANLPKPEEDDKLPEPTPGAVLLVREIVLHYHTFAKGYYVRDGIPTGEHLTIKAALRPLKNHFGDLPARDFGPKRLKKLQDVMIGLDWSRRFINKATGIVKRCFTWAASEELIPGSVPQALRTVGGLKKGRTAAREKPEVEAVSDADVDATLPELGAMVADMVRIQRLTGCRPGELLAMTAAGIDRTDPECWSFSPDHHKTAHKGKARTIFIGPRAIEVLALWLLQAGDGRLFPMDRDGYRQAIWRGCHRAFPHPVISAIKKKERTPEQAAELKAWQKAHQWSPNRLRHTAGTEIRSKFGLEASQCVLGHARADVTQIYAERDLGKAREIARKIG
jgi:integrase